MTTAGRSVPTFTKRIALSVIAVTAVAGLAAGVLGCGRGEAPRMKIVLLGIDGMDWRIADPLLEEGKLPNLAKIIEDGVLEAEANALINLPTFAYTWAR